MSINNVSSYDDLIKKLTSELYPKIAALSSPVLSRQENITHLRQSLPNIKGNRSPSKWYFFKLAGFFLPELIARILTLFVVSKIFRIKKLPENFLYIRSWLINGSFTPDGNFNDRYFSSLAQVLGGKFSVITGITPVGYRYLLCNHKKIKKNKNCIVPIGLLNSIDLCNLLVDYLFSGLIKVRNEYYWSEGRNITRLINYHLLLDYLSFRTFHGFVEKFVTQKILEYNINGYIYVYENQAWEKVSCYLINNRKVPLIGYQSSGFSKINSNFFYTKNQYYLKILPNIILTTGKLYAKFFRENGCELVKLKPFAALRYRYSNDGNKYVVKRPILKNIGRILYAFSSNVSDHNLIIEYLKKIFGKSSVQVDLKFHPLNYSYKSSIKNLPFNFKFYNLNDNSISGVYDLVLFNDNSYGFDALFEGVKSCQLGLNVSEINDRFIYFSEWKHILETSDLISIRDQLELGRYRKDFNYDSVNNYINLMYKFPDPEGKYAAELIFSLAGARERLCSEHL